MSIVHKEEEQKQHDIDKDGLLQLQMSAETRKMVTFYQSLKYLLPINPQYYLAGTTYLAGMTHGTLQGFYIHILAIPHYVTTHTLTLHQAAWIGKINTLYHTVLIILQLV